MRRKMLAVALVWLGLSGLDVWATIRHYYWLSTVTGAVMIPLVYSISFKLIAGIWPPWGAVFRELFGRKKDK